MLSLTLQLQLNGMAAELFVAQLMQTVVGTHLDTVTVESQVITHSSMAAACVAKLIYSTERVLGL